MTAALAAFNAMVDKVLAYKALPKGGKAVKAKKKARVNKPKSK